MVGINELLRLFLLLAVMVNVSACVTTEALYAEYNTELCNFVASVDESGAIKLHEQNSDTFYPWEPAVYFEFDSSELSVIEQERMTKSIELLKQFSDMQIGLQGFTDHKGSSSYNLNLALARVNAVKAFLISHGIADSKIFLQTIGEPGRHDDVGALIDDASNRRVELMLIDKEGRAVPYSYKMSDA